MSKLYSMTAYSECTGEYGGVTYQLRISSVNSRGLDLRLKLPFDLSACEPAIRDSLKGRLRRGKIDLQLFRDGAGDSGHCFNRDFVSSFLKDVQTFVVEQSQSVKLESVFPVILQSALSNSQAFASSCQEVDSEFLVFVTELVDRCLQQYDVSALVEGGNLGESISHELALIHKYLDNISNNSEDFATRLQEYWDTRIVPLFQQKFECDLDDKRLFQELLFYLEKKDITEELVRFKSHLSQIADLLADECENRKGKKFEFILQEMLREANTIGSKSSKIEITQLVVEIKTTLEKLREQVLNVC